MKFRFIAAALGLASSLVIAEKPASPPVIKIYEKENSVLEHRLKDLESAAGIHRLDWTYVVPDNMEIVISLESNKNGRWTSSETWTIDEKRWGTNGVLSAKVNVTTSEVSDSVWHHSIQAEFSVWGSKSGMSYALPATSESGQPQPAWGQGGSHLRADEIKGAPKVLWNVTLHKGSEEIEVIRATAVLHKKPAQK